MRNCGQVRTEPGNMIVMGIGVWLLTIMLVFIVASSLSLHQGRRELYTLADEVALSLAASISDRSYYSPQAGPPPLSYDAGELTGRAYEILQARHSQADLVSVRVNGNKIGVELRQTVRLPLVPSFLGAVDEVRVNVISWARLRTMTSA
ncbi:hypothetical protein ACFPGO_04820 [Arcanobacterium canis]|uniref:Flp pilus-assembly TadG-like N-terminal domain-containing protein n=1 Tax=Arcanobacterium canis TaxID=999183 RepID=A0ABY8FZD2_9ACTO|nr:hypothetical protein [Arcanobacterium canis]WFM83889.1 hypothetical protein P7079_02610 [Arcanobacterium canis]